MLHRGPDCRDICILWQRPRALETAKAALALQRLLKFVASILQIGRCDFSTSCQDVTASNQGQVGCCTNTSHTWRVTRAYLAVSLTVRGANISDTLLINWLGGGTLSSGLLAVP